MNTSSEANGSTKPLDIKMALAIFLRGREADRVREIFKESGGEIYIGDFEGARFALRAKGVCRIEIGNLNSPLATCYDTEDAFIGPGSAAPAERRKPEELIPFLLEKCAELSDK